MASLGHSGKGLMARPLSFKSQDEWFLQNSVSRRRNPVKPATVNSWKCCVDKGLVPNFGGQPLGSINNASLRELVTKMYAAKLSAQSIVTYTNLTKLIVAS